MAARRKRARSSYSAEPGFSANASFGTSELIIFLFGLRHGIRLGLTSYLAEKIQNCDRSARTSTTSGPWPTPFSALTVW